MIALTEDKVQLWWWAHPSNVMGRQTGFVQNGGLGFHRRIQGGVGSSHERLHSIWDMASIMAFVPYKLAKVGGDQESAGRLQQGLGRTNVC